MALTQEDLRQIRGVVDESIAHHPRFDELKSELKIELVEEIGLRIEEAKDEVVADVCDVMQTGFTLIGQRFDEVDQRIDGVEGRLGRVEGRLGRVENRLGRVENRIEGLEGRFDKVDRRLDNLRIVSNI